MDVQPTVKIDTCPIKRVKCAKMLGVEIDEHLNWEKHIECIASKVSSGIGALKKLKEFVKVHIRKLPFFPKKLAVTRGAKRYMNEGERINRSGDICFQTGRKIAF